MPYVSYYIRTSPRRERRLITKSTIIDKLREISFFSSMSDFDLRQIAGIVAEKSYAKGAVIIEERTEAERFFIVHKGKIEISKRFEGGDKAVLSIQSDGAFFGEMAILDEGRRSASVCALEPTTVLEIQKDDFETLLYKAPVLAYRILRELSGRLRETGALLISFLTQRNRQLYRAYIDTMTMVVQTIEDRNAQEKGHNRRVTGLSMAIGRELGLEEEDMLILELSSLLHDMGMLTVPEKVLEKPGPLSNPEIDTVRAHTLKSISMIQGIPMLQKVVPFIRHHHEHFDGSGYPDGLSGEQIPLMSRIMAVVDAYESMIWDRPYRGRRSDADAAKEIKKHSGAQFDPAVVKAFLKIRGSAPAAQEEESLPRANAKLDRLEAMSFISQDRDQKVPCRMNVSDFLLENAEDGRQALIEAGGSRNYGELKAAAARIAGELLALGLSPGDRIGILGQNSLFWAAAYLAIMKLRLVAVPFSVMLTPEDADRNARFAECKVVFMDRRQRRAFGSAFRSSVNVIFDDVLEADGPSSWPKTPDGFDSSADAALMFTSGTTSKPKAVRVTHDNIQANTSSIIEYLKLRDDDCMLVILPFFYCFGTSLLHTHLRVGARLALCNSFTFPETALDMMERESCTGFAGVPSSFQLLLRISSFKSRSLPHLRIIQQAGGKLHKVLVEELAESKPAAKIFVMYGQTEATARLSCLPPEDLSRKAGSIGKGIPGVQLRVVDESGVPVAPGETGEIWASGRNISPGYLNDPEATAAKFVNGELHTGDLATIDNEGYIYVVDRKDDFIKSWGYRVSSQEVESCVLEIPDLVSAAAVGVPDMAAGESIHVFAVLKPGSELEPAAVIEHCSKRLGKHMVPEKIEFIKALPLNSSGKVLKSELRKLVADGKQ
jgi:long-chain acyl-CoA synthetase